MNMPRLSLIVAMTQNGVIGRDNAMPWHLPSDLQRFKRLTWGKPIIMGRKTYDSIGRPLKGRTNIVVTRSDDFVPLEQFPKSVQRFSDKNCGKNKGLEQISDSKIAHSALEGVVVARTLAQAQDFALSQARQAGEDEIFIIGGAQIFKQVLAQAHRIYMTEILAHIEGDTFFPQFDLEDWHVMTSEMPGQGEHDTHPTRFVTYHRSN